MLNRFIFRSTYFENISIYAQDGFIRAKNNPPTQLGHRISYSEIVSRRGETYTTPNNHTINDYVPFYFSPIQAMSYTIAQENVDLIDTQGLTLRKACFDDLAFVVARVDKVINKYPNTHYVSDNACNSSALVRFGQGINDLNSLVNWHVFDEDPLIAATPEIGYNGACKYFFDHDNELHSHRKSQRMAEFLVQDKFDFGLLECIIVFNEHSKKTIEQSPDFSKYSIPIYIKSKYF